MVFVYEFIAKKKRTTDRAHVDALDLFCSFLYVGVDMENRENQEL